MENERLDHLGDCIRILRKSRGLTQEILTEGVCDRTLLSHLENGEGMCPTVFIVQTFAERLGLTLSELLDTAEMGNDNINVQIKMQADILLSDDRYEEAKALIDKHATWRHQLHDDQFFRYVYGRYYYSKGQIELAKDMFLDSIRYTDPPLKLRHPNQRELLSLIWYLMCEIESGYSFCRMKLTFEKKMRAVGDNILHSFTNRYSASYIEMLYTWALLLFKIEKYEIAFNCLERALGYCKEAQQYKSFGKINFLLSKCHALYNEDYKMKLRYLDAEAFFKLFNKKKELKELHEFKKQIEEEKGWKI